MGGYYWNNKNFRLGQVKGATGVAVTGRASAVNTNGYLNFTDNNANVTLSNTTRQFDGYAWSDDLGWVAFGTQDNSLGPVSYNAYTGALSGKAKVLGDSTYLDFNSSPYGSNVLVNSSGTFSGFVWSESLGWLNFSGVSASGISLVSPNAPQNVRIYDTSDRDLAVYSITLRWQAPSDLYSGLLDYYIVERGTDSVSFSQVSTTTSSLGYLDTSVSTGTTYYYRIKAHYTTGATGTSDIVYKNPTGKYTSAPTLTEGPTLEIKPTSIKFTWKTDRVASSYVRITQGNTFVSEQGHVDYETTHTVTVTGLKAGTNYNYQLRWMDSDGNIGETTATTFTTADSPYISDVLVSNITLTSALVSWKSSSVAVTHLYYGKTVSYGSSVSDVSTTGTTSHALNLTNLDNGTTYHFKIKGTDSEGNELISDDYSFSTLPMPQISEVLVQPLLDRPNQQVKVSWRTNVPTDSILRYRQGQETKEVSQATLETSHELETGALSDQANYTIVVSGRDQFGNAATSSPSTYATKADTRPPKLFNLQVESQLSGQGNTTKAQAVISWETDEPATAKVEYGVGVGESSFSQTSQESTLLDTSHVVVIPDLDPSQTYQVRAVSKDNAGNVGYSESYLIVTNQAPESVFNLILRSLERAFGWLGKLIK